MRMWFAIKEKAPRANPVGLVYDRISRHFAETRVNVWPPTERFLKEISPCRVGDLGCGNGRGILRSLELNCSVVAIDSSKGQLETARRSISGSFPDGDVDYIHGDISDLPLPDGCMDNAIMVATLHHLGDRGERIKALNEAHRCLKEGGLIQISVWTWDQERFRKVHDLRESGEIPKSEWDGDSPGDFLVPWRRGEYALRFYHLYGPGELEKELDESGLIRIRSYFDGRNHWAECIRR